MKSKDCDNSTSTRQPLALVLLFVAAMPAAVCVGAPNQMVRMWPDAVVVDEEIRLGDLCELTGFDSKTHERLRNLLVMAAPPAGGSRVVALRQLRELIAGAGINLAQTIVKGAAQCGVSRPRVLEAVPPRAARDEHSQNGLQDDPPAPATLRDAVVDYFERELSRYGGKVQIDFSRRSTAALDLAATDFEFQVRRRTGRALGMIDLEVDVRRQGQVVQTVHLQPIVGLSRRVVVARRAINDQAAIRPADVQLVEMSFNRLDRLGSSGLDRVIGQRVKQFIAAGTVIELRNLESVPLVKRGQLVDVISRAGGITVVTTAKAMNATALGETVELKGNQRRSLQMVGIVTGPRRVELRGQALALGSNNDVTIAGGGTHR